MKNEVLVDIYNVKYWGGIHGSIRQTIELVTQKVSPFIKAS